MEYAVATACFKLAYLWCCVAGLKYKTAPRILERAYDWQCRAYNKR